MSQCKAVSPLRRLTLCCLFSSRRKQVSVVVEYKRINTQLETRLDKATLRLHSLQTECCPDCQKHFLTADSPVDAVDNGPIHGPSTVENERVQKLELELAATKLALVEKECDNQELLHQLSLAANSHGGDQQSKNSWLSKTIKSAAIKTQAALVGGTTSTSTTSLSSTSTTSITANKDAGERKPTRTDSATSQWFSNRLDVSFLPSLFLRTSCCCILSHGLR